MEKEIAVEFKNVTKEYKLYKSDKKRFLSLFFKNVKYKRKLANDNISFKIYKGEAVVILGLNGAGKSTLLKMITGVAYPTEGEITVNGSIGAVLELTAGFDPEFTGRENIHLKGQLMGLSDEVINNAEEKIIEFSELGEYIDQPVRTYSSGMKARLGFSINVNIEPDILVIDEALSVGDAKYRKKSSEKMKEIIQRDDVTVLYVTHSPKSSVDFCTRGMVLEKGKLIFDGDIDEAINIYNSEI